VVFAVAFVTALAFRDDPSSVVLEQSKMVEHLENCLQKKKKWNASHCRQRDWKSTQMQGWEDHFQFRLLVVAD
jgi:hypothetical protein